VIQAPLDKQVLLDSKGQLVLLVTRDLLATLDSREMLDCLACRVPLDRRVSKDLQEVLDLPDRLVGLVQVV